MAISRAELALTDIINDFKTISTAAGFRTDPVDVLAAIRHPDQVTAWPEIGIELGDETIEPKDDGWTIFDSKIPVYVVGTIKANTETGNNATNLTTAMEALLHDMKRIVATLFAKYVNAASGSTVLAWNIIPSQQTVFERITGLGEKMNYGQIATTFTIRIRNQDGSFDD